jgi:hypothetical protein
VKDRQRCPFSDQSKPIAYPLRIFMDSFTAQSPEHISYQTEMGQDTALVEAVRVGKGSKRH